MQNRTINDLKAWNMVFVVLGHIFVFYANLGVLRFPAYPATSFIARFIYGFHIPLYFYLSGCVYGICVQRGKYRSPLDFLKKKTLRLLVPYWFWGFCVVAPVMVLLGFAKDGYLNFCLTGILEGANTRHLWFVLSLFTIFIIVDGVRHLTKSSWAGKILLVVLGVALALVYPQLPKFFSLQGTGRCLIYFVVGAILYSREPDKAAGNREKYAGGKPFNDARMEDLHSTDASQPRNMHAGHLLRENTRSGRLQKRSRLLAICLLVIGAAADTVWAWKGGFNDPLQRLVIGFLGIAAMFGLAELLHLGAPGFLKRDSFGIYLAHPMLIYIIMDWLYRRGGMNITPWVVIPVVFVVVMLLSTGITELLRKLHLSVLIGE